MNPSRLFIKLPVATSLLMAAILLSGLFAFKFLPLSSLPEVDYPTIQVQTFYPGASPEVMTSSVTAPLERQFGQMPGLNQMTSASSGGASVITMQFSLDLGLDVAEQEVQAAINAAGSVLPKVWLVSEFLVPTKGFRKLIAVPLVAILYWSFAQLTGLEVRRLPDHAAALQRAGFTLIEQRNLLFGLLISQEWTRA